MELNITVEKWNHRVQEGEGTDRYDAANEPLIITPHKNLVHIPGNRRSLTDWPDDTDLTLNGIDLGTPDEKWGGGGLGWYLLPEEERALINPGAQPPNDELPRPTLNKHPRTVRLPNGMVGYMGFEFPAETWVASGGYMDKCPVEPPEERLIENYVMPATHAQSVDLCREIFLEGQRYQALYFYLNTRLMEFTSPHPAGWGEAFRANKKRYREYRPVYDDAYGRFCEYCKVMYLREKEEKEADERRAAQLKADREKERWEGLSEAQKEHERLGRERQEKALAESARERGAFQAKWAAWTDRERRAWMELNGYSAEEQDQILSDWHSGNDGR